MGKHTYSLTVLVCTLSTGLESIQQWILQDDKPLPVMR